MGHVTAKELSICYAADIHVKFDETTLPFCRNWSRCKDMLFEACSRLFVESQRNFVLSDFIALADPKNKGNRAGKNGQYTLGQMGAPYRITPKTIPHFFSQVRNVLAEHVPWVGGQMFMLVPLEFRTIFMLSDYAKQAWPGISAASTNILGIWPQIVNGFNIFDTTHLPHFKDASDTTRPCHYIIAGHKEAYAYAADIIGERVVMDIDPFSINYKMLSVWGGAMLHPNFAALAYVNFDAEMTVT
jgi:hypothetical protein